MESDALIRVLWLKDIHLAKGPRTVTTESFLTSKNITISGVQSKNKFEIFINNTTTTKKFFSHEADRFACAAFETLTSLISNKEHPRSIGWALIKAYYSAFFSLHALIRTHGWACTRLVGSTVSLINKEAQVIFPGCPTIEGGIYLIKSDSSGAHLEFKKLEAGAAGGSHESLWSILSEYLTEIAETLKNHTDLDPTEVTYALQSIASFSTFLSSKGGPIWLTQIRNRINYQHQYGAWHPYAKSTCDLSRILTEIEKWKLTPSQALPQNSGDELVQFSTCCSFIASLCKQTFKELNKRSITQSPFRTNSGQII